ncbi:MAG TPA: hypothetical protein VFT64_02920 [Rickettsiales bacterium]|nr:hypothetical protein [Rickettsiales bacterium]
MRLVILAILLLVLPASICGATEQENKIVIIRGKKFFPLGNARHRYGNSKGMPMPENKYMHDSFRSEKRVGKSRIVTPQKNEAGKTDAIVKGAAASAPHPKTPDAPNAAAEAAAAAKAASGQTQLPSQPQPSSPRTPASDVLSIFEPEGQQTATPPPVK